MRPTKQLFRDLFRNQVGNNTLADMFVRNTDATNLPADMFSAPGVTVDMSTSPRTVIWYDNDGTKHVSSEWFGSW